MLSLGMIIALVIGVLILIAGLMIFITVNKFAIIGGGLIALAVIFGLKGKFNKDKLIFLLLVISLGLFFILSGNALQTQFMVPQHVFMDGNLGMVTMSSSNAIQQAYFKNNRGSGISNSNVGEQIKICDVIADFPNYRFKSYAWYTDYQGSTISHQDITNWANQNKGRTICRAWTPEKAGEYEVRSVFEYCSIANPSKCEYYDKSDFKKYNIQINSIQQTCHKSPYKSSWMIKKYIDNGQVLYQNVYKVDKACNYKVNYENIQTQCDDNYLIANSNLRVTEGDGWSCVSHAPVVFTTQPVITTQPNTTTQPVTTTQPTIISNCNADMSVKCLDNTTIIAKNCVNGQLVDSGSKCKIVQTIQHAKKSTWIFWSLITLILASVLIRWFKFKNKFGKKK